MVEVNPCVVFYCLSVHPDYLKVGADDAFRMYETKLFKNDWLNAAIWLKAYEKICDRELIYDI